MHTVINKQQADLFQADLFHTDWETTL